MKQLRKLWIIAFLSVLIPELSAQQQILPGSNDYGYTNGECLIKFKQGTTKEVIDSLGLTRHFSILQYYPDGNFFRVRIPEFLTVQTFTNSILANAAVEFAQPDYYISFFTSTSGQSYPPQWSISSIENSGCNLETAQKIHKSNSSDIKIGIIDDGFLSGNLTDFFKNTNVVPVVIAQRGGVHHCSGLIEGIWYSVNNGAQIITINAGAPETPLLKNAIEQAFNRGTIIISAAADSAAQAKGHVYPAAYNQYCIAVTAHGYQGKRLHNSLPDDYIDLSAPSEIHVSKTGKSEAGTLQGSSVASLYVTAAAVMISEIGINSYDKIRQVLEQSCFDPPPKGWDKASGWGFLDIVKAVQFFPEPDRDVLISGFKMPEWGIQGEQLQAIVAVKNQGNYVHDVTLTLTDKRTSKTLATTTATIKPDQSNQFNFQWNTEHEQTGPHLLAVTASITGDEDLADNTQFKEITIVKDTRDVEISGVEFTSITDEQSFIAAVQIDNLGTYTEMITIRVMDRTGTILGQKSISIQPQLLVSVPVKCTTSDLNKEKFVKVTVEASELQETDLHNNCYICPLIFSRK